MGFTSEQPDGAAHPSLGAVFPQPSRAVTVDRSVSVLRLEVSASVSSDVGPHVIVGSNSTYAVPTYSK